MSDLVRKALEQVKPGWYGTVAFEFRDGVARKASLTTTIIADDIVAERRVALDRSRADATPLRSHNHRLLP